MSYGYNPTPFTGMSTGPWTKALSNMSQFTQGMYNQYPDMAMQNYIDVNKPSNVNEEMLRRFLPILQNQWTNEQVTGMGNVAAPMRSFADFLGTYNFNQAFANLNPQVRHAQNNFYRPVRTITI